MELWLTPAVLDIGGGAAMHSFFSTIARRTICCDVVDQNTRFCGEFIKLLAEKCERNGHQLEPIRRRWSSTKAMRWI